jgi:hypothetical protein
MGERKEELLYELDELETQANHISDRADTAVDAAEEVEYEARDIRGRIEAIKKSVETLDDREVPDEVIGLLQDVKSGLSLVADEIQAREGEEIGETVIEFTETLENNEERIEEWLEENYYE